jgi:hypothetical protein
LASEDDVREALTFIGLYSLYGLWCGGLLRVLFHPTDGGLVVYLLFVTTHVDADGHAALHLPSFHRSNDEEVTADPVHGNKP